MFKIQSGVLDRTRIFSNILMIVLVAGNIYFSIQYTSSIKLQDAKDVRESEKINTNLKIAKFLRDFIDIVLNTKGEITYEQRIKLESHVIELQDPDLSKLWNAFLDSKDSKTAQERAVKIMSVLASKMI